MTRSYCPGIGRKYIFSALHSDNTFEALGNGASGGCALSQVETQRKFQLSIKFSHFHPVTHSLDLGHKSIKPIVLGTICNSIFLLFSFLLPLNHHCFSFSLPDSSN